jgi:hypothetical protein
MEEFCKDPSTHGAVVAEVLRFLGRAHGPAALEAVEPAFARHSQAGHPMERSSSQTKVDCWRVWAWVWECSH